MKNDRTPDDVTEIARYLWRKEQPAREMDEESAAEVFLHYDAAKLLFLCGARVASGEILFTAPDER